MTAPIVPKFKKNGIGGKGIKYGSVAFTL